MPDASRPLSFIEQIIEADNTARKWGAWPDRPDVPRVHTRFPPEPNGYLHIGHAKSICLNFGLAQKYGGKFNLRFDDTNPAKEEQEYVDSIIHDVKWLGADFEGPNGGGLFFASNYFDRMYEFAEELVRKGKAYVCDLTAEQVGEFRGPPTRPGRESPFRARSVEENLTLLREMRDGKHPNGSKTLRAKIDMASPNLNLRDPVLYRIVHETHHNTGDRWCLYPMYDWAHGFEDSIEGITHSICTLEFENHRPLYDWFIDAVNEGRPAEKRIHHPQQIEFAKFATSYIILSKRNLLKMVEQKVVSGWDDPRMPTISGFRRRGYTADSIRNLMDEIGVTKVNGVIDFTKLENAVRDDLNKRAPRRMGVLNPIKVVLENWPADKIDWVDCVNNPENPGAGTRKVPFTRELYIEREDFMEEPPKKFFRLSPGREVRLRYAYFITCTGVVKDPVTGQITELHATVDPATRGGDAPDGRKVKATLHWVSASHAVDAEVRLFDRLFTAEAPGAATGNFMDDLNPSSLATVRAKLEPSLREPQADEPAWADDIRRFQFERMGYFCVDRDSKPGAPAFNRTVTLKDTWAKAAAAAAE